MLFVHVAFGSHTAGVGKVNAHSFTSVHVTPSPMYPALQPHVNEPAVFVQNPFTLQLSEFAAHSSTSMHVTPSPA